MRPEKYHPKPILVALLHELLNVEQFGSIADVADALKTRAARLRIPYDPERIADAMVTVYRTRPLLLSDRTGHTR
jgi:hypothetical protein